MNEQLSAVVRKLVENTNAGLLRWKRIDPRAYHATVNDTLISLSADWRLDPDGENADARCYWFRVYDPSGGMIEEEEVTVREPMYPVLDELFKSARRSASNGSAVLDKLLRTLNAQAG